MAQTLHKQSLKSLKDIEISSHNVRIDARKFFERNFTSEAKSIEILRTFEKTCEIVRRFTNMYEHLRNCAKIYEIAKKSYDNIRNCVLHT